MIQDASRLNNQQYLNHKKFSRLVTAQLRIYNLSKSVLRAILKALSEKDETADIVVDSKGRPEPDTDKRDVEIIPLRENINNYFQREIKPFVPDAWIDNKRTKIGYEIPFTKLFYQYKDLRSLGEIETEIKDLETEIMELIMK